MAVTSSLIRPPPTVSATSRFFSSPSLVSSAFTFATPSRFPDGNSSTDFTTDFTTSVTSIPTTSSSSPTLPTAVTQVVTTAPPTIFATPSSTFLSPSSSSATVIFATPTSDGSETTTHFSTAAVIVVFSILGLIVLGIVATVTSIIRKHLRVQRKLRQDAEDASAPMLPDNRISGMQELRSGSRSYGR